MLILKTKCLKVKDLTLNTKNEQKNESSLFEGDISWQNNSLFFDLFVSNINLDTFKKQKLQTTSESTSTNQNTKKTSSFVNVTLTNQDNTNIETVKTTIPFYLISSIKPNGKIKINTLKYNNLVIDKLVFQVKTEKNILTIPDFSAFLYGGSVKGRLQINNQNSIPTISLNSQIYNIGVYQEIHKAHTINNIKASLNAEALLSTEGSTIEEIENHLTGKLLVNIAKAEISGINFSYLICKMISKVQNKKTIENNLRKSNTI